MPGRGARMRASSTLAAYWQLSQATMASSPLAVSTWNSCDSEPPMLPVSASTARKASPQRVKMRV